jgi:hypothetical protein
MLSFSKRQGAAHLKEQCKGQIFVAIQRWQKIEICGGKKIHIFID